MKKRYHSVALFFGIGSNSGFFRTRLRNPFSSSSEVGTDFLPRRIAKNNFVSQRVQEQLVGKSPSSFAVV